MSEPQPFEQFVTTQLIQLASGLAEVKAKVAGVGMIAEQTLAQATKTNGRMTIAEDRLDELEGRNHDADLVATTRRAQVDEVKARAFSLIRAMDNKWVTGLAIAVLVSLGAAGQRWCPW